MRIHIPEFETLSEIAEFWDEHSTADFEHVTHEVHFELSLTPESVPIKLVPELAQRIRTIARGQGISIETLVNVWLTEKTLQQLP